MSPRPRPSALALASSVAFWSIGACTLSRDYYPASVDALQAAPDAGGSSAEPALSSSDGGPACRGGELSGCPIELAPVNRCETDLDCPGQVCASGSCASPSCFDGIANQGEAGRDCAGPCVARCAEGDSCTVNADCGPELFCPEATHLCTSVSCRDGVLNGNELEADCGGGACPGCPVGSPCNQGSDCLTGVCGSTGKCAAARCDDTVKNQDETGVDCGGACPDCPTGQPCRVASDCQSGVCKAAGCASGIDLCCQAPRCDDGVRNGGEPVTDCGSAACGGCPLGSPCSAGPQCASGLCQAGSCRLPPCVDGVRDGSETDIDCGGTDPSCARCGVGDRCAGNNDCASGSCVNGQCSNCTDGKRNGTETGIDCGGACGPCGPGEACGVDAECQSGACQDGRCCGGTRVDCTRCARRLVTAINCSSNGAAATADCNAFLDCLAANPAVCPVRHAAACSDDPSNVCDAGRFGGNTGAGVGLADAILGSAPCDF